MMSYKNVFITLIMMFFLFGNMKAWDNYRDTGQGFAAGNRSFILMDGIHYQIVFNSPDYIYEFYRYIYDAQGVPNSEKEKKLHRKVSYAVNFLWFNITARASSMEELITNYDDYFVIQTDRGKQYKPEIIGHGHYPRYRPIEVDGHIYDHISWEKTFGIRFPKSVLCEENCEKTIQLICQANRTINNKILGTWNVRQLRDLYQFDDEYDCNCCK